MPPPRRHNPNRLSVEQLEDRNPVSTTLNWLLSDLWLSPVAAVDPLASPTSSRAGASRDDLPATQARHGGAINDRLEVVPLGGDQTAEAPRPAHHLRPEPRRDPVGLPGGIDLGLALPFRGLPVSVTPAALATTGAGSVVVGGVESPTTGTPGALLAPAVAAAAVDAGDDTEVKFAAASLLLANPTISITPSTAYIPVNANRTSKSPWKKDGDGNTLLGLPAVRDFSLAPMRDISAWNGMYQPPAGPAIADPELKPVTVTVTPNGHTVLGPIQIFVTYVDFYGSQPGSVIRLWKDQTKEHPILLNDAGNGVYSGSLPDYPTCTFYVEGAQPSKQENDVKLKVTATFDRPGPGQPPPPPAEAETALTITPVVNEFSVNPKDPPTATWLKTAGGAIFGISSGEQADGAGQGSTKPGVKYTADLNVKGIGGKGWFLQDVIALSHGNPAVELTNGNKYNPSFGTATFPLLDHVPEAVGGAPSPFYPSSQGTVYDSNRKMIWSVDTPTLDSEALFAGNLSSMDATFQARMYVVWQFPEPDLTIYTLASANWQAVFQASTGAGGLQLSPNSVVSVSPMVRGNWDPAKVMEPTYNSLYASPFFWEQV